MCVLELTVESLILVLKALGTLKVLTQDEIQFSLDEVKSNLLPGMEPALFSLLI